MFKIPQEPVGYTCPSINELESFIDEITFEVLDKKTNKLIKKRLEKLRKANKALREWGYELSGMLTDITNILERK